MWDCGEECGEEWGEEWGEECGEECGGEGVRTYLCDGGERVSKLVQHEHFSVDCTKLGIHLNLLYICSPVECVCVCVCVCECVESATMSTSVTLRPSISSPTPPPSPTSTPSPPLHPPSSLSSSTPPPLLSSPRPPPLTQLKVDMSFMKVGMSLSSPDIPSTSSTTS